MSDAADVGPIRSAIVSVGDELLLGRTVDTNAAWLASRLAELGARTAWKATVGDDIGEIVAAMEAALARAELVVVTGGLGPTADDRTRDAAARLLDAPLEPHADVLQALEERYAREGEDEIPPANHRVTQVPRGGTPVLNPVGTAPALVLEADDGRQLILFPGVPRELKALWEKVEPELEDRWEDRLVPVHMRTLRTTGIAESRLAPQVDERMADYDGPVEVAFLPDLTGVDLRLTVRGSSPEEARAALDDAESRLAEVLDPWRVPGERGELAEAVLDALAEREWTLALGESCTGGLVAKRLTDVPGASRVVAGGVVAYGNAAKTALLGVDEELLQEHGAVSAPVARALAAGACRRFEATCGVGITGIAGPGGGSEEKPVGTVHMAVRVGDRVEAEHHVFAGDRESVRIRAAQAALRLLLKTVEAG